MIQNRLEKNLRKLQTWSEKHNIEAYRLYDRDIPEFPFIVDRYKDDFLVYDKSEKMDEAKNHLPQLIESLKNIFGCADEFILVKRRQKQKGTDQYQKLNEKNERKIILENGVPLLVNLQDYLDTGLFLDHRPLRHHFLKNSQGLKFLNLFSYTGSVSVMAALGGATTYSIDMSKNYLDWSKENFKLNKLDLTKHFFFEEDVLQFISQAVRWPDFINSFDSIFLDPPTFSNSKSMLQTFDVERDQFDLVVNVMKLLRTQGTLYFSTNKRDFKLSPELQNQFKITETTAATIPIDFHDQKIHRCYEIRR